MHWVLLAIAAVYVALIAVALSPPAFEFIIHFLVSR